MSEYQYYEFQAIDRPLGEADRAELQALSSRARVTSTSFTNHYNYGDFRGDPRNLVERWFDLHLYLANWGTRRLMIRLPKRLLDPSRIEVFLHEVEWVEAWESGENLIVDMHFHDEESAYASWEEGEGWLGALAPLRADLLAGDLRLLYLLWLTAAEAGDLSDDEKEPLPGIGPLNGALDVLVMGHTIARPVWRLKSVLLTTRAGRRPLCARPACGSKVRVTRSPFAGT